MTNITTKIKKYGLYTLSVKSVLLMASLASAGLQAQPPHGYERLALHSVSANTIKSDYFAEKTTKFVYENYAKKFGILGTNNNQPAVEDKRLIDIELHVTGDKPNQKLTMSGIWIENKGYFKKESWLQFGFTSFDLEYFDLKEHFIPLDIETYKLNGETLYAVIWQRNVHKVDWVVSTQTGFDAIRRKVDEGYRVVEFDQYRHKYNNDPAFAYEIFDAILVENTGDNTLDAEWKLIWHEPKALSQQFGENEFGEYTIYTAYWGFFLNENEKIVDIEFLEFIPPNGNPEANPLFPYTWALVISHPIPDCRSTISTGALVSNEGGGITAYDAQDNWGRIIDYEGGPNSFGIGLNNGGVWYGPGGWHPIVIHAC